MLISWMRQFLFTVLMLAAAPIEAFVDPPKLITTKAVAGVPVYMHLRFGICDTFLGGPNSPRFTITRTEALWVSDSISVDDENLCIYQIVDRPFRIGVFPEPGNYTLIIRREYDDLFGARVTETLATFNIQVGATSAVPSLSWIGLLPLALLILYFGFRARPSKRFRFIGAFSLMSGSAQAER